MSHPIQTGALAIQLLREGRPVRLQNHGDCMVPALREGAWVTIEPVTGPVSVGAIVAIELAGQLKLHRLVARDGSRVRTCPDHGPADGWAEARALVGTVRAVDGVEVRPGMRHVKAWLKSLVHTARYGEAA